MIANFSAAATLMFLSLAGVTLILAVLLGALVWGAGVVWAALGALA